MRLRSSKAGRRSAWRSGDHQRGPGSDSVFDGTLNPRPWPTPGRNAEPRTGRGAAGRVHGSCSPAGNRHADAIVAGSEMQRPRLARAVPLVNAGRYSVKVIASTLRKGNVVEK